MLLTLLVIVPMNCRLNRRPQPEGRILAATCLVYGIGRFILDVWRATDVPRADPRYAGFTLAQYASAALVLFGAALLLRTRAQAAP
jgi:prolipoprotein diacylglyceryltransferase